jgi:hypothetical protein
VDGVGDDVDRATGSDAQHFVATEIACDACAFAIKGEAEQEATRLRNDV